MNSIIDILIYLSQMFCSALSKVQCCHKNATKNGLPVSALSRDLVSHDAHLMSPVIMLVSFISAQYLCVQIELSQMSFSEFMYHYLSCSDKMWSVNVTT